MRLRKRISPIASPEVRGDINVTPLVDVCLVLLIIFMVVTPMLQKGVDVTLPETTAPEKVPETAKQLTVSVKQDGTVFVQQNWVPNDNIPGVFKEIHDGNPDRPVVVKGDRRLKYKRIREVMQLLNEAGFERVGLIMDKKNGGGAI